MQLDKATSVNAGTLRNVVRAGALTMLASVPLILNSCKNNSAESYQTPVINSAEYKHDMDSINAAYNDSIINFNEYYYGMQDVMKAHKKETKSLKASKPSKRDANYEQKCKEYNAFNRKKEAELAQLKADKATLDDKRIEVSEEDSANGKMAKNISSKKYLSLLWTILPFLGLLVGMIIKDKAEEIHYGGDYWGDPQVL